MAIPAIHKITKWSKSSVDGFGQSGFDNPVEVVAFWIDDSKLTQDNEGKEFVSMAKILSAVMVAKKGDRVQFSDLAGSDIGESYIVRRVKFVENGQQTTQLYTTLLSSSK
jgi:hypothetical protein